MTQSKWWILGAILLGAAIVLYFLLFCPVECR